MQAFQRGASVAILGAASFLLSACQMLTGLDDFKVKPEGSGGSAGGGGGAVAATSSGSGVGGLSGGTGGSGGTNSCVETMSNPEHCGQCDHSCMGGLCEMGECKPFLLTQATSRATFVAVDSKGVYWGHAGDNEGLGEIWGLMSAASGQPIRLVAGAKPNAIAADGERLYWTNAIVDLSSGLYNQGIMYMVPGNDAVALLFEEKQEPHGIALAGKFVYWSTPKVGEIKRGPKDGTSNVEQISTTLGNSALIAVDSEFIYWHALEQVVRKPIDGSGVATSIAKAGVNAFGLAVDDMYVYWTNFTDEGSIYKAPKDQVEQALEPITSGQYNPRDILVDDQYVYWTTFGSSCSTGTGTIVRRQKSPNNAKDQVIAVGQTCPSNLVMDEKSIYWGSGNSIYRLAK